MFEHTSTIKMLRAAVATILKQPLAYQWSLQGFGMLRLHMSDEVRLNIWDSRYRVPNVSLMHTHPWDFDSIIISGRLENVRYLPSTGTESVCYNRATIKPGPGGGIMSKPERVSLYRCGPEFLHVGDRYTQKHDEIHVSHPDDGCITLNYRTRVGDDTAHVFWPENEQWVSAEPRPAKVTEIIDIIQRAREAI